MKTITVSSYEAFLDLYRQKNSKELKDGIENLIMLFVANDDPETKKSWCPDCVIAKPVIEKALQAHKDNDQVALVTVQVGQRNEWKTPENPYRLHELKINCVPTILSLGNKLRLNGSECSDEPKVLDLFSKST